MAYYQVHRLTRAKLRAAVWVGMIFLAAGLFVVRCVRRRMLAAGAGTAGLAAYDGGDWSAACRYLAEYLDETPDDAQSLEKFAEANLMVRPLQRRHLRAATGAYRRLIRIGGDNPTAYDRLMRLYGGAGNYQELAYVAARRLQCSPGDAKASVWLAGALMAQVRDKANDRARLILSRLIQRLDRASGTDSQYAPACKLLCNLAMRTGPGEARQRAQAAKAWLDRAVRYDPAGGRARLWRARFLADNFANLGLRQEEAIAAIRTDLLQADRSITDNPLALLELAGQWALGQRFDRAESALRKAANIGQDAISQQFIDPDDWRTVYLTYKARITAASSERDRCAALADEMLAARGQRYRMGLLAPAIELYAVAAKPAKARQCLQEYLEIYSRMWRSQVSDVKLARLNALVARAEGDSYRVAQIIEPVVLKSDADPVLWQLLAEAHSKTGRPRRGIRALKEYLRLVPEAPDMVEQLAREYVKQGQWLLAHEAAVRAEVLSQANMGLKLMRIQTAIESAAQAGPDGQAWLESLDEELATLGDEHPKLLAIRILQAAVACYQGRFGAAERILARAIDQCSNTLPAEMQLARLLFVRGRLKEATDICQEAWRRHPRSAAPRLALAELQLAAGSKQAARDTLVSAIDSAAGPRQKRDATVRLALIEIAAGRRHDGLERLKQLAHSDSRDLYPRSLMLRLPLAVTIGIDRWKLVNDIRSVEGEGGLMWRLHQASLWLAGDDWQARKKEIVNALEACTDGDPGWSAPALLLAELHRRTSDDQQAEKICLQAFSQDPASVVAARRLVELFIQQRQFTQARDVLRTLTLSGGPSGHVAAAWKRELVELHLTLASAAYHAGQRELAEEIYRETLKQDPDNLRALNDLAWIVAETRGDYDAALKLANTGLAIQPTNLHLLDTREMILSSLPSRRD